MAVAGGTAAPAAGAKKPPPGAVKLAGKDVKKIGGVTCGKVGRSWLSGTSLPARYFISHRQLAKNAKKQAKKQAKKSKKLKSRATRTDGSKGKRYKAKSRKLGKKAKKLKKRARAFRKRATKKSAVCAGANAPRFDVEGATGLALRSASGPYAARRDLSPREDGSSNMEVIEADGGTRDAVASGTATISKFLIAPNGRVYVLFAMPVQLGDTSRCLLAEVNPATGDPACIDHDFGQIMWKPNQTNPAIQFDASGGIYYAGWTNDGSSVVRKYSAGRSSNLVTDNVEIRDFLVLADGTVFLTGRTTSTGAEWVRRIPPNGGLQSVRSTGSNFLKEFPDGNVYMGLWGQSDVGVRRFLTGSNQVESKYWISDDTNGETVDTYFRAEDFCSPEERPTREPFCGYFGAMIKESFETARGEAYVIAGYNADGILAQYYPTVRFPATAVRKVSVGEAAGNNIVLGGLNASEQHVLTLHDTTDNTEAELIGPSNEIEIYHLNYVASRNKVLFDGLRFSDNQYVLGEVDLATKQVTFSSTRSSKWDDFQTFD